MNRKAKMFILAFCPLYPFVALHIAFSFIIELFIVYTYSNTNSINYERYRNEVTGAYDILPSSTDFGEYESVSFSYKKSYRKYLGESYDFTYGIFLKINYSDSNYHLEKDIFNNNYKFIDKPYIINDDGKDYYSFPVTSFTYKDINFKITINENYLMFDEVSSQSFGMIGFDDENNNIYFLYYYRDYKIYICKTDLPESKRKMKMISLVRKSFYWV